MPRLLIGVRIDGIGSSAARAGLCFYYGAHAVPGVPTLEWVPGLTEIPGSISTSVDIFAGTWRTSAFTFPISYRHAPTLLRQETLTERALTAPLTASATTVELADVTLGGQAVFVGDETILLGTWDGVSGYAGCTRGLWGSEARPHRAGAFVFIRPPHWTLRRVELWTLDVDTGEALCRWRGYLRGRPTGRDGTKIELEAEEYFATWRDGQIPRQPHDTNAGRALRVRGPSALTGELEDVAGAASVPTTLADPSAPGKVALQLGGAIVVGSWSGTRLGIGAAINQERLVSRVELPELEEGEATAPLDEPVWELLVWDRLGDLDAFPDTISPTYGLPHAFHPLRVALALLRTDPVLDQLGSGWGLGLTHLDWSEWEAEIEATPQLQIDQLVIGWDGDTVRPFERAEQLLRSYGYLVVPRLDGSIGLARFRTLSVGDYAAAIANRVTLLAGTLQLTPPEDVGLTELRSTVGELPWRPGRPIVVQGRGSSDRAALLSDARRWEVDLQHVRAADALRAATELAEGATLVHYGLPTLMVRVPDGALTSKDLDIGRLVTLDAGTLQTPWVVDQTGAAIPPADWGTRVELVGWIVGRRQALRDLTVELELRLIAYHSGDFTRERAPSAVLSSGDGTDATTYQTFEGLPDDARTLTVGDQVSIYSRAGELLSDPTLTWTVTATAAGFVALDTALPYGDPGDADGQVLRLAVSRYYANTARYAFTERPYTYLADAADEIGRFGGAGEDPADTYGAGLGLG